MKYLVTVFFYSILLTSCFIKKENEPMMKILVNDIHKAQSDFVNELGSFECEISLTNQTDSILQFWMMTCSWQLSWTTNKESLVFSFEDCPMNYPKRFKLQPSETMHLYGIISDTSSFFSANDFRLGFYYVDSPEVNDEEEFHNVLSDKILQKKDIIWSEPFSLVQ